MNEDSPEIGFPPALPLPHLGTLSHLPEKGAVPATNVLTGLRCSLWAVQEQCWPGGYPMPAVMAYSWHWR